MSVTVSGSPYLGSNQNPAYSGTFIPEIWSGKLIEKFYASTVLSVISNTDYEGEIKDKGDRVHIRQKPTITVSDYQVNQALAVQRPAAAIVDLTIDYAKYFNLVLDDVMEIQSDINLMSMWADDAAEQMKIVIDTAVLLNILNTPVAANSGATAGAISSSINLGTTAAPLALVPRDASAGRVEILDLITRLGQTLDEQNIPETGRWITLPAWAAQYLKQSDLRQASISGDSASTLRTGRLGMIDRFTLYTSNLLPNGVAGGLSAGEWVIYAGHPHALTFASQVTKLETLRSEQTFGTLLRGLQVYGFKVLDGKALVQAIVTP
ncbi:MAG TPA: hypothetical protein VKQ30_20870 [Ktedonobacterales bacterium]|nr:hypothetical protein [Ktedonobacterales bacterium]